MKKVLMIGPGRKVQGGMSTVINNYYDVGLDKKINFKFISTMEEGSKLKKLLIMIKALLVHIVTFNYNILHVHMSSGASFYRKSIFINVSKFYGKKVIIHMHGADFKQFYREECDKSNQKYIRKIFNKVDKVIALSEEWGEFLKELCSEEKIQVMYNSIIIPKNDENKDYKNNIVLFLGRLGKRKGIYDLIDIIPKLIEEDKNIIFNILGDGEIKEVRELCIKRYLSKNVRVLGWLEGEEKEKVIRESTILVLPSYNEGMPMSILEGMGYALPIVSTNVGGISQQVINNENGFLITAGDKHMLKNSLIKLIKSESLKKKMGKKSYEIVSEKFNIGKVIVDLLKLYEVVGKKCEGKGTVVYK